MGFAAENVQLVLDPDVFQIIGVSFVLGLILGCVLMSALALRKH